jgi:hypothetical protein
MLLAADIQSGFDKLSTQDQQICETIVQLAYQVNPSLQNRIQWKAPTFTLNDNWHHWLFSITKTKKGITVTFHKGWLLEDPEKVLCGDGAHLRVLRFTDPAEIKAEILTKLISSAIRHQLDM